MKVSYRSTRTVIVEKTVPDHFTYDDTVRGKVVDAILKSQMHDPEDIHSEEESVVENAFDAIERARR